MNLSNRFRALAESRHQMLSTPAWKRYLFEWHRPSHVVWALVLVFGVLFGGPLLVFSISAAFGAHDSGLFRDVWMYVWLTTVFSVFMPVRSAVLTGLAMSMGRLAREWCVRMVGDDWRAYAVDIVVAGLTVVLVIAVYRWRDANAATSLSERAAEHA
jgi:hypothetical protein